MKERIAEIFKQENITKYLCYSCNMFEKDFSAPKETDKKDIFVMTAKGNGMKKAGILNGDVLFIKRIEEPRHNSLVSVMFEDGSIAIRRYLEIDGNKILRRENGYTPDLINPIFSVFGEVIAIHRFVG